jgi:protein TonB
MGSSTGPGDRAPLPPGGICCGPDQVSVGDPNGTFLPISSGTQPAPPPTPAPAVRQFRPSRLLEGSLIRRVQPLYPPLAKSARIQGPVVLAAVISKAGTIEDLQVLSGHPMLVKAALAAVSQWRYRPYVLNNEPIEVETQITVNFILSGD